MWCPYTQKVGPYTWEINETMMIQAENMRNLRTASYRDWQLPLSSEATAAIAQHNASIPLLKLPPEIRNKIYELVCGGQFLHVDQCWSDNELKFTVAICHADLSEQAAEDLFHAETTAKGCHTKKEHRGKERPEKISTDFLAICRQVYNEARHIPYTTNTFGFDKPSTLDEFTNYFKNSGYRYNLDIRSVYLDIEAQHSDDERYWKSAIYQHLVPRLPQVHRISINLNQRYQAGVIGCRTPTEFEARHCSGNYLMSALLELQKLPLNRVTFVISDMKGGLRTRGEKYLDLVPGYRWTLAEKQVWARYIKDSILQKDNQQATSSTLEVERDTISGNVVLELESSGEERRGRKLDVQEE